VRMRLSLNRMPTVLSQLPAVLEHGLVSEHDGFLRLNNTVIMSDVEAFLLAVERARGARGADQVAAAEEALSLRVPGLLPDTPRMYRLPAGRQQALYSWVDEPRWERAAARLTALWHEAARLLARAYRTTGRADAALAVATELLAEVPLDRAAHEELLLAAAHTSDQLQLSQAWQQVQSLTDGEPHPEVRALYARLMSEHVRPTAPRRRVSG
jgi:DNA-binding SARP family transcriptional activator